MTRASPVAVLKHAAVAAHGEWRTSTQMESAKKTSWLPRLGALRNRAVTWGGFASCPSAPASMPRRALLGPTFSSGRDHDAPPESTSSPTENSLPQRALPPPTANTPSLPKLVAYRWCLNERKGGRAVIPSFRATASWVARRLRLTAPHSPEATL